MSSAVYTEVYVVRHAECAGNREGLFRGRVDFPLDEEGLSQARALAEELREVRFDAIYTSPMTRSLQTALALAEGRGMEPILEEGFVNISLGPWEGKPKEFIRESYPEEWRIWLEEPEKLVLPGAETIPQVQERAYKALLRIIEQRPGQTIAVVSHRAVIKPLLAACLGIRSPYFWRLHVDTASYSILRHWPNRGFMLMLLNQTRHLKDLVVELY